MKQDDIITQFKDNTALVSSIVHSVKNVQEALETAVSICCSKKGGEGDPFHGDKIKTLAAHGLNEDQFKVLEGLCSKNHITLVTDTLRNHGNGIDMGITFADYAIAETGTLVINSNSEEKRLATMISDIHVALLEVSKVRATALGMSDELEALTSKPSSYTAFITGPSRTADIERVLAIGVHGPLELHIVLLDDGIGMDDNLLEKDGPRS